MPPDLACCCCPPLLLFADGVVCCCRCHCLPLPLLSSPAVIVHRCHLPPLQPSLPLHVSAISCRPLLSVSFIVRHPILHAVVIRCCRCPPLPSLSAAAVIPCCSHHHHSAVSAVSHRPLLSFPIALCRSIMRVVDVRHHCHPPPLSSAVAVPPLVLPPTRW
jgi:hypothetical protein